MEDQLTNPNRGVGHLAILVVYHLRDDGELDLLRLHFDRIQQHTSVPYTIFASANRVSDIAREIVRNTPNVVLCEAPLTSLRGSAEHGFYLDILLRHAMASEATHICTFDVDSFPIDDAWVDTLAAELPLASGFAGVLRSENGDVSLPHPSCSFATREFYERFQPTFSPSPTRTPQYRKFLRSTGQSPDTGIDIGEKLWSANLPWARLVRTNVVDPHYLIAGIYGRVVFHLGGNGTGKLFRNDLMHSRAHRLTRPIEWIPERSLRMTEIKQKALRSLRSGPERRLATYNREIHALLHEWLLADADGLFEYLHRGTASSQRWLSQLAEVRMTTNRKHA